jgi:hypothetical protein
MGRMGKIKSISRGAPQGRSRQCWGQLIVYIGKID